MATPKKKKILPKTTIGEIVESFGPGGGSSRSYYNKSKLPKGSKIIKGSDIEKEFKKSKNKLPKGAKVIKASDIDKAILKSLKKYPRKSGAKTLDDLSPEKMKKLKIPKGYKNKLMIPGY